jgi:uncharacterized protein YqeY
MSTIKQRINDDVKAAMRGRDRQRLGVLRMITAAVKQKEVDERLELDDAGTLAVLDKLAKQHRDAIDQFRDAGRADLVEKETFELDVVREYLPQPLAEEELADLVRAAVAEAGAGSLQDMGKVMGLLKPRVQGRADMGKVSALVKQALQDL